jgi:2-phosphosulfolactate phosphatase
MKLDVTFTPAEFDALRTRDLSQTVCVVLDILRATSTMVTALANGASAVIPVATIEEAVQIRATRPDVLLGGERFGAKISAEASGGTIFDLGNSPREYTRAKVSGRIIVSTTTNGTRALKSCAHAKRVLIGAFLNLRATTDWIESNAPENLVIIASGTFEEAAYEDALGAGALCDRLWPMYEPGHISDSALLARNIFQLGSADLAIAMRQALNARRLLAQPDLAADVDYCSQVDCFPFVAVLQDGEVRRATAKDC